MSNAPPRMALVPPARVDDLDQDAALAQAALAGLPGAHRALWERFVPMVRRMIRRQLGPTSNSDVDDVIQDVFALVFRDLRNLREPRALCGFVATLTVHAVRHELRRRKLRRLVSLTSTGHAPDVESADADPVARLALHRLYSALERFKVVDRMIFVLRYVEGHDVLEVAAALDLSPATVKRRAAHVSERLSKVVANDRFLIDYLQQDGGQ
ncbi:MAG: sigma-70 family RNA polymerase sigma factor [Deltaproteobacteria bacterium]|nr:sigma-70 family RNA polymerase sigma factor [Deltaproteobacteria bacterium]